jgi:phosphatidylinositol alpha-1,6-mannosyltransferase
VTRGAWLLTRKHPPSVGGMQQLSFHLAAGLRELRPVTVVAWRRGQWGLPLFFVIALARLVPALVLGRVSVLHLGDPALAALALLPRLFRVPVAVTVHGLDITWPSSLYQAYLRLFFWRRMDAYVCISRHVRDLVLAAGTPDDQVLVIPVGMGEPAEGAPEPALEAELAGAFPVLLAVGRLVERKGLHWFLREVAPTWLATRPSARLVIAGDGPLRPAIEQAIRERGLEAQVRVLGAVSEARKAWLLQRCDVVLMPNIDVPGDAEGFGLVALEAGRAGRWVIVSDLQGLRDAVTDQGNGRRVEAGNANAWMEALTAACTSRDDLLTLGRQGREVVTAQFSWAAMASKYDRLLRELEADAA